MRKGKKYEYDGPLSETLNYHSSAGEVKNYVPLRSFCQFTTS